MSSRDFWSDELREPAERRAPAAPAPAALQAMAGAMGNQAFGRMLARTTRGQEMPGLKEDTRRNQDRGKHRGGHDARPLPPLMIEDKPFGKWYHRLKQKQPGDIAQILGVDDVGAAFNISQSQAETLYPYYRDRDEQDTEYKLPSRRNATGDSGRQKKTRKPKSQRGWRSNVQDAPKAQPTTPQQQQQTSDSGGYDDFFAQGMSSNTDNLGKTDEDFWS
jgi:hypothetical protein